jgi:large repetitive protein
MGPWYFDDDGDGYGDPNNSTRDCNNLDGFVSNNLDCNDNDISIFPGNARHEADDACVQDTDGDGYGSMAPTVPAGFGADCNDEDPLVFPGNNDEIGELCIFDVDGDGFGASDAAPPYDPGSDCDDNDANINPSAQEICDDVDNDCNTEVDEYNGVYAPIWYGDADGDGYGDENVMTYACSAPEFYVNNSFDCDDANPSIYPNAPELCTDGDFDGDGLDDEVDNNCNGSVDESSAVDVLVWFADADNDGYGSSGNVLSACTAPTGYVDNSDDCNDNNMAVFPGAEEMCNGYDDDCDTLFDEGSPTFSPHWYLDSDGDGFGDPAISQQACYAPTGYSANNTDCDDSLAEVYPNAPEYCNGMDNDCDTVIDDNAVDSDVFYIDSDGDGRGSPAQTLVSCAYQDGSLPAGYSEYDDDCDDNDPARAPHFSELCTGSIDENCDGDPIFAAVDLSTFYADSDADGYGNINLTIQLCSLPSGYVSNADDCNDTDSEVQPFMPATAEICNGKIDRCENQSLQLTDELDLDGDGYVTCELDVNPLLWGDQSNIPLGGGDCDDSNADRYPNAAELCNGIFEDCSAADYALQNSPDLETDDDGDGFVECTYYSSVWSSSTVVQGGDDCDDSSDTTYVGAAANYPSLCAQDSDLDGEPDCNLTGISQDYNCGYGVFYSNGDGPDFHLILAGVDPLGLYEITHDYYVMTTEVTMGMWDTIMGGNTPFSIYPQTANFHQIQEIANQLSVDTGFDSCYDTVNHLPKPEYLYDIAACPGYRLPTEAEWDYAARSGTISDFWTGQGLDNGGDSVNGACDYDAIITDGSLNPYLRDYAWFCGNTNIAQPVAQLIPNGFGLYDMHGNVREAVNDVYSSYFPTGTFQNPNGPNVTPSSTHFTFRGGQAVDMANDTSIRTREAGYRNSSHAYGFRMVRTVF